MTAPLPTDIKQTESRPDTSGPSDTTAVDAVHVGAKLAEKVQPIAVPQAIVDEKVGILENAFNIIYKERMNDVPIINDKIEVRAIGFQQWQKSYLCIMITPWFMNLMLLPGETENWDDKKETTSSKHTFPSGNYQFLVGFEPAIGKYQMCSYFHRCSNSQIMTLPLKLPKLPSKN